MEIMELLQNGLEVIVFIFITGCGVMLVKEGLAFLNGKIDEVQATTKLAEHEQLNQLIDGAQGIIENVVLSVNQVFVDTLKAEGKFDKESAEIAKNSAIDKAKELLPDEAVKAIEVIYGNLDTYLDVTIEAIINKIKQYK